MRHKSLCLFLTIFLLNSLFAADQNKIEDHSHSTRIMTFNFQEAVPSPFPITAEIREDNRKKHIKRTLALKLLNRMQPDILGFQETHKGDIDYFDTNSDGYNWEGRPVRFVCRDLSDVFTYVTTLGESGTDYNPIFYNTNKYECDESNAFWLNEGMVEGEDSRSWDIPDRKHFTVRACTYAKLKDKHSKKVLWVFNTHLSLEVAIREKEMEVIENEIARLTEGEPTILIGDLNISDLSYYHIPDHFIVSQDIAEEKINPHLGSNGSHTIDHILLKNMPNPTVNQYGVVDYADEYTDNGIVPSDHRPVYADLLQ